MLWSKKLMGVITCLLFVSIVHAEEEKAPYRTLPFQFGGAISNLILADFDGDGLEDLVRVEGDGFLLTRQQREVGFDFAAAPVSLATPSASAAWQVVEEEGRGAEIFVMDETGRVRAWGFDPTEGAFGAPRTVAEKLPASLPRGVYALDFLRDINGDDRRDLIVPGTSALHLYLASEEGYRPAAVVKGESTRAITLGDGSDLRARLGQRLRIPIFELRDVNGDGRDDLVSEADAKFWVHLARDGGGFDVTPTYGLDFEAENRARGENFHETMDTSNLLSASLPLHEVKSHDINGDGHEELVHRKGDRIFIFRGGPNGVSFDKPLQILRASGNLVTAALGDENEDGLDDLLVVRIEKISLADVFVWLLASGSIDITILVYPNDGERFARRPSREITVKLKFPSIVSLMRRFDDAGGDESEGPLWLDSGDLRGAGEKDAVVLEAERIRAFFGRGTESFVFTEELFAEHGKEMIEYSRDKDDYVLDVTEFERLSHVHRDRLLERVQGAEADVEIPFEGWSIPAGVTPALLLTDMNEDRRDDLFLFWRTSDAAVRGAAFISN